MREGMSWIIPVPLLSLVTVQHLEKLVCGMPQVSIPVLKKVTRYLSLCEGVEEFIEQVVEITQHQYCNLITYTLLVVTAVSVLLDNSSMSV